MRRAEAREGVYARELARAIRAKCLDCCGGMRGEVRGCRIKGCALWPYRLPEGGAASETGPGARMKGQMDINELIGEA